MFRTLGSRLRLVRPRIPCFSTNASAATSHAVDVYEVSPRDGLQNEATILTVDQKMDIIESLARARPASVEVCSFVRADRVPTMAGAEEVCERLNASEWATEARANGTKFSALILNQKGFDRFLEHPLDTVTLVVSCTDGHSKANAGKETMQALQSMLEIAAVCKQEGIGTRGYASMAFGCPIEGDVDPAMVQDVVAGYAEAGVDTVVIADTIGVAVPAQVEQICGSALDVISGDRLGLHMHDTYERALENCQAGLDLGVRHIDAAVGGTGGCPFAKGSAGNLATEQLLALLDRRGHAHGIQKNHLEAANRKLEAALGRGLIRA